MRTVQFLKPGREIPNDPVFLTSRHREHARLARQRHTIYHRNDWSTIWTIPVEVMKEHFHYDRSSGIYRTDLKYKDIACYMEELRHN